MSPMPGTIWHVQKRGADQEPGNSCASAMRRNESIALIMNATATIHPTHSHAEAAMVAKLFWSFFEQKPLMPTTVARVPILPR